MVNSTLDTALSHAKQLIDAGAVDDLARLIERQPALCASRNDDEDPPTDDNALLLYATRWPGARPNGAAIVKLLVESGADPMLRFNATGETVLHWASSMASEIEVVNRLIDCGADLDAQGGVICGGTPLMNALYFGHTKIAVLLQRRGAFTANMIIASGLGDLGQLQSWHRGPGQFLQDAILISPGQVSQNNALLTQKETQSWTYRAVICALVCEQYQVVDWFIERGFDIDLIPDNVDWSCLHHAAYWGSLPMAMYLVTRGANLEVTEQNNANPADYGVAHVHPEVMQYLVDMGTVLTPEKAAYYGRLDKVMLIHEQCDDRARLLRMTIGNTGPVGKPIHASIKAGRVAVARFLLQKDPALWQQTVDGKTALEFAEDCEDEYWLAQLGES